MASRWMRPPATARRVTSTAERGKILIDLLELVDALPPAERHPLTVPTFEELCERR